MGKRTVERSTAVWCGLFLVLGACGGADDGHRDAGGFGLGGIDDGDTADGEDDADVEEETGDDEDSGSGEDTGPSDEDPDDGDDSGGDEPEPQDAAPEIPFDPTSLAQVCARNNGDRVAQALCGGVQLSSITQLQEALAFESPFFSMTANSSSLVGRDVSALNPRLIVGERSEFNFDGGDLSSLDRLMAMGFARGEQFVELMAFDPISDDLNFYLLMFEQSCNANEDGCDTADLITPAIESDWTRWTLYQDTDLENTSLDCAVCHQPMGVGTPKVPRLQEISNSWTHWFPVHPAQQGGGWSSGGGGTVGVPPQDPGTHGTRSSEVLWNMFIEMHGSDPTYGGVPLEELQASAAGPDIETFVRTFINARELPPELSIPPFGSGADSDFFLDSPSMEVNGAASSWSTEYERVAQGDRLPLPSYKIDITSDLDRQEAIDSYKAVMDGVAPAEELVHPSNAIAYDSMVEMSVVPREDATAEEILSHMCARCHNGKLDQSLSRARFDATSLGELTAFDRLTIADRVQRSHEDKLMMPPRRFATMPAWAVARVVEWAQ